MKARVFFVFFLLPLGGDHSVSNVRAPFERTAASLQSRADVDLVHDCVHPASAATYRVGSHVCIYVMHMYLMFYIKRRNLKHSPLFILFLSVSYDKI